MLVFSEHRGKCVPFGICKYICVFVLKFIFMFGLKASMYRPVPVSLYFVYGLGLSFRLLVRIKFYYGFTDVLIGVCTYILKIHRPVDFQLEF